MERKIIIILVALFLYSSLPINIASSADSPLSLIDGYNKHPRKKYKKRTDHAPKIVHVRGYRKKNGTYVHSYKRWAPRRR